MKDIIIRDNIPYLLVKPVKKLFHSSMVVDVINSDRKFAVNLLTNELTIVEPERPQCYYMRDNHTFRHFNKLNIKSIVLGIREELVDGFTNGTFYYQYGNSHFSKHFTDKTRDSDLEQVIAGLKGMGIK